MTLRPLVVMLALLAGWGPPRPAVGQSAKAVRLRIGPRVGDTLRMRFDQVVQSAGPAPQAAPVAPRSSAMHVMSRSVVERSDDAGSVVLTITDSAVFDAPGVDPRQVEGARRAMRGRWARMRVSPSGAMEMIETRRDGAESESGAAALTRLPGTLPDTPVKVGDTWTRDLVLPWGVGGGSAPFSAGGKVGVVFRLDSVTQHGTLAYISMRGALARSGVTQTGSHVNSSGTMTGRLRVDLRRGWMTESRAEFAMVTTWLPANGSKTQPMQLRVTITQSLRCDND